MGKSLTASTFESRLHPNHAGLQTHLNIHEKHCFTVQAARNDLHPCRTLITISVCDNFTTGPTAVIFEVTKQRWVVTEVDGIAGGT